MERTEVDVVLDRLDVVAERVEAIRVRDAGNSNWHLWPRHADRLVLRRYHARATPEELAYEHAVLHHLAQLGWAVPAPVGEPIEVDGRWWCRTVFVDGAPRHEETVADRRQRGRDMARLQIAMRELVPELGQRPGWRPQHTATTVNADICWRDCIDALSAAHQGLAEWAEAAAAATAAELAAIGADELPLTLIHGDFASWNVHYVGAELVGVIDFGLSHLDSRPYELAIARTYRAVEVRDGFRDELARVGSPLTDLEERAIEPIQRAFRVDMVAWALDAGLRTGRFDVEMIESQLARTGTSRPR